MSKIYQLDNFEEQQNTLWLQKTAPSFTKLGESLKMCLDQNFQADKSISTMLGKNQVANNSDNSDDEQQNIDESLVCENNELDIEINPIEITEILKIDNKNQKEQVQNKLSIIPEEEDWNLELSSKP